jgi:formaldehyde-activating enzyme involved in methanogenesis
MKNKWKASFQSNMQGLAKLKQGHTPALANEDQFLEAIPATSWALYTRACIDNMQRACLLTAN